MPPGGHGAEVLARAVLLVILVIAALQQSADSISDADALLRIRSYMTDPLNKLESWKFEESQKSASAAAVHCSWLGITCDPRNVLTNSTSAAAPGESLVIGIDLSSKNLSGTLSDEIGWLSSLQSLNLAHNNFTGPIPSSISKCTSLKYFNLSDNAFSEAIPHGIFTNLPQLQTLDFWINSLTGVIPKAIGDSQRLEHLDLGGNYLEGPIPVELCSISSLKFLTLAGNALIGPIPEEISRLQKLEWIYLGYNQLNGSIPRGIGALTSLVHLDLVFNELSGPIPADSIANLAKLEYLFLYTNDLSGDIPESLGRSLTRLISLDLSNNSFTGRIPESIGSIRSLEIINLFQNNLTGTIPASFSAMPRLRTLALWRNNLTGAVDPSLGTASNLTVLDLSTNSLTGSIPPALCTNGGLFKLILFDNEFTGSIPEAIASCKSLKRVRLQNNRLSGIVPESLTQLTELYYLDISNNHLTGTIQGLSWKNPSLQILSLQQNLIAGSIPTSIFFLPSLVELQLSANGFSGIIPEELGQSELLTELDLSSNELSGPIPVQIGKCSRLVSINLSGNRISGQIPASIGQISTLGSLDLSRNLLTGEIPSSLASMQSLEFFNVSLNRLSGAVPSAGALSAVLNSSSLFGNHLCSTPSSDDDYRQLGLPLCRATSDRAAVVLSWMLGVGLSVCVGTVVIYSAFFFLNRRKRHIRPQSEEDLVKSVPWRLILFRKLRVDGEEIVLGSSSCRSGGVVEMTDRDGKLFLVKKFRRSQNAVSDRSDVQRMKAIAKLRHENLVRVLGLSLGRETGMILFQHCPNGSLDSNLFPAEKSSSNRLDWNKRLEISIGAAKALAFLHTTRSRILHGSFSGESIFLDANFKAKVLVEFAAEDHEGSSDHSAAPELTYSKIITEKTDVYAFGITVLELLTGKKADDVNIVDWIQRCISEKGWLAGNQFLEVTVVGISPQTDAEIMRVIKVALQCTSSSPAERPTMSEVVKRLENARQSLPRSVQMTEIITE